MRNINIIVAMDEQGVIGLNNKLPWHLPADLAYFKAHTLNKTLVMGRHTYESLGKPLPHRTHIILTTNRGYEVPSTCNVCHSVEEILEATQHCEEIMVIGGAQVYSHFLPLAHTLHITRVHHVFKGDTFFPAYNPKEWHLVEECHRAPDEKNPYPLSFCVYKRLSLS